MRMLLNADDYRSRARKFLPRGLFDYIDRGTEDEVALRRLRASLDEITLMPSVLTGHDRRSFDTALLGQRLAVPLVVAPTALAGLVAHDGETKLARAASRVGIPVCISTQSVTTVETIRRGAPDATLWFQLYVWRDRALTAGLLERARACGCETLVVTADTPVSPNREYNRRNGFGIPFVPSLRSTIDVARHPRWLVGVLARYLLSEGMPTYGHYPDEFRAAITRPNIAEAVRLDHRLNWDDVRWLRQLWPGKLIIKGVLAVKDAETAAELGCDAIVVSAHGGRNLDCLPAPAECLPAIVEAVGGRLTVLADSGVRRGTDVLKYLALGAGAVLLGRLPLWGLAAGGEAGAEAVLRMIVAEMDAAMAFLGAECVSGLQAPLR
ncbi:alpha-hydroxyacid dehydrogenase, FMN-dependent L-lactate dehydrogenase [Bradyrhizobium sp. YR681]|uniref:alpha-hydroxy acid oxidase n=1 Tax=Bradyrhizobium sp. YR681 TaxID=1144344 RepID=UPI000270E781|nr:alpha-hydroxy acid oxidase [Bradyrhizobium sp. YR681]EJN12032.1 alpha-hydroxyacid dehydrogenase, FMN-dependent L-lactate dehydrogenase [Bradyrhizobium sp. YR681]